MNYRKTSPSTGILRLWEEVVASTTSSPPFTSGSHELNSQSAGVEAEEKTDVKRMQFTNWETTKTTDKLRKKNPTCSIQVKATSKYTLSTLRVHYKYTTLRVHRNNVKRRNLVIRKVKN